MLVQKVSPPLLLTLSVLCLSRWCKGVTLGGNRNRTTGPNTVGARYYKWTGRVSSGTRHCPQPTSMSRIDCCIINVTVAGSHMTFLWLVPNSMSLCTWLMPTHPLGGYLGPRNTLKIQDCFHWTGIVAEVHKFTFEWVSTDLIGLLPKSICGHKYIFVIVDNVTHYPEAVPLNKATSRNITSMLILLSSSVGINHKGSITDQGTHFISKLMVDFCWLLQVKHLCNLVYHPRPMDSLCSNPQKDAAMNH